MGFGRGVTLTSLSILLVLSLFVLGIFWSIHAFLYPQIYEQTLAENNAYSLINISQLMGGNFIKLPSGGMPALVNGLLENTLSYMRGDTATLNLTVPIDTQKLTDFFMQSFVGLPDCQPGQDPFKTNVQCKPTNVNSTQFLQEALQASGVNIIQGESVNLATVFNLKNSNTEEIRHYVILYEDSIYGLAILIAILFIAMFFISPSRTRWQGISFVLSGALLLVFGYLAFPLVTSMMPREISFISNISTQLLDFLSSRINLYALVAIGIGIIAFVASFFFRKPESRGLKPRSRYASSYETPRQRFLNQQTKNQKKRK